MKIPCYTWPPEPPNEQMSLRQPSSRFLLLTILAFFFISKNSTAQQDALADSPWAKPAHDLVQEVMSQAGSPSSVAISVENQSDMSSAEFMQARKAIEAQFRSAKIRLLKPEAAIAQIKFTFSESIDGYLWIAQIEQGPTEQTIMLPFVKPAPIAANKTPLLEIRRNTVLSQKVAILDFVTVDDRSLLVLEPNNVNLFKREGSAWKPNSAVVVTHSNAWPRDLRGRIYAGANSFEVFLPGTRCTGSLVPTFSAQCRESDDPWPLLNAGDNGPTAFFSSTRNFHSGVLSGSEASRTVPPFFTAASLGEGENALWILAGVDGRTRLFNNLSQPLKTITSLGSDLAGIQSSCGSSWQLLVTSSGDATEPDSVQAFEVQNKEVIRVSEPLAFDGPITALWSSGDKKSVRGVVKNKVNDEYEAFNLSISCSR